MRTLARTLTLIFLLWQAGVVYAQLPSFEEVKAAYQPSDATLLDQHGVPLADIRFDHRVRRFEWIPLERFSPALRDALILSEDQRFFEHDGVDLRAVAGAMWHNLWHSNHRGASTLTMQLAGLLDPTIALPNVPGGRRSLSQKWDQSLAAKELEQRWSKAQILEAYLNLAPFRGDLQGVHAASAVLFGKSPDLLDRTEALLITAILPSPNANAKRIGLRACARAKIMGAGELCTPIEQRAVLLDTPRNRSMYTLAPHLARQALHQAGERVSTTLDATIQKAALEALLTLGARNGGPPHGAAALVIDNSDASIRAWVGGLDARAADLLTQRSTWPNGAVLFAAGSALERRVLTAATLLVSSSGAGQSWHSLRMIVQQPDIHLVPTLLEPGNEALANRLRQAGFDTPRETLPAITASPAQWVQALRPLITTGQYLPLRWQAGESATAPKRLWKSDAAFITADFLADAGGPRAALFADTLPPQAGWTALWRASNAEGTTAMLIALNDRHTVATIIEDARPRREVALRLAEQAMRELLQRLGNGAPSRAPKQPAGLVSAQVSFDPPVETPRKEWFVRGTEVALSSPAEMTPLEAPAILVPRSSDRPLLLAEDESILLEATPAAADAQWWVDGVILGEGQQLNWSPAAGHHRVELRSPSGVLWDQREFDTLVSSPTLPAAQSAPASPALPQGAPAPAAP